MSFSQLLISSFLEKIHSEEGEILDNKIFYKTINQSKCLFTTLTRLRCFKHKMTLQMLSAFVNLGKQNLQIVWN